MLTFEPSTFGLKKSMTTRLFALTRHDYTRIASNWNAFITCSMLFTSDMEALVSSGLAQRTLFPGRSGTAGDSRPILGAHHTQVPQNVASKTSSDHGSPHGPDRTRWRLNPGF